MSKSQRVNLPSIIKAVITIIGFLPIWLFLSLMYEETINDTLSWGADYFEIPKYYSIMVTYIIPICLLACILSTLFTENKRVRLFLVIISILVAMLWYFGMFIYPINLANAVGWAT